jgi:etoposide-induced 2.4 mRNA
LLLGSVAIFNHGISPILTGLNDLVTPEARELEGTGTYLSWLLYQSFWLAPICVLCYVLSVNWYQSLADRTFKYLRKTSKTSSASRVITDTIYSTLVWIFVFLQVQCLLRGAPLLVALVDSVWSLVAGGMSADRLSPVAVNSVLTVFFLNFTKFVGLTLMCVLYGWYCFDPVWIAEGVLPDVRYHTLHERWAYFLGFGFPYVVMIQTTGFFTGYGLFLACFPISIMLGALSDSGAPYRSKRFGAHSVSLELFRSAKKCSAYTLKTFERYYRGVRNSKTG